MLLYEKYVIKKKWATFSSLNTLLSRKNVSGGYEKWLRQKNQEEILITFKRLKVKEQ